MSPERRQYQRQRGPFDGTFSGSTGQRECRIIDLSPGGCFIDAMGAPEPGAGIDVTVALGETRFTVPGQVIYHDRIQGFGVRFLVSDQTRALAYAMGFGELLDR